MHKIPYPPDNGTNQRIYLMVSYLKKYYRIGVVVPEYHPDIDQLSDIFDHIWYGESRLNTRIRRFTSRQLYKCFFFLLFKKHLGKYVNNPLGKYNVFAAISLYRICISEKPSLIIVQKVINSVLSTAIARKFNIPVIIDTHDLYKLQLPENTEKNNINLKQYPEVTSQHEKDLLQLYDALIAIQYQEGAILSYHFPEKTIITALHAVPSAFLQENKMHIETSPVLLFIASESNHNVDAINYFIDTQFNRILKIYPEVVLIICGSVCKHVPYFHTNLQKVGRVENVRQYYERATIVINPVRHGSGLKIKTVDALASGKCLVTTPIGAEGLLFADQAMVCTEADSFASIIVELLNNKDLIRLYEEKAYKYSINYLTPQNCFHELTRLIGKLTRQIHDTDV